MYNVTGDEPTCTLYYCVYFRNYRDMESYVFRQNTKSAYRILIAQPATTSLLILSLDVKNY